jgi:hypothetical protein
MQGRVSHDDTPANVADRAMSMTVLAAVVTGTP